MKIVETLKKNDFLRKTVKNIKIRCDYKRDANDFCTYYMEAKKDLPQIEYKIMLIVHSLEKGMSSKTMRPFGQQKVLDLIRMLDLYLEKLPEHGGTPYKMGVNILRQWKHLFDENKWEQDAAYIAVDSFLKASAEIESIPVGTFNYTKQESERYKDFDYLDAIQTRHSAREFVHKKLETQDIEYCVKAAIASPSACNRQMCKVYYIEDKAKREMLSKLISGLGGFEKDWNNYFVFTYDMAAFLFYGERNQGYFNTGLFAMNFANALHFRGIGSCFLQWANKAQEDRMMSNELGIPQNERIVVVLAAGYYAEKSIVPRSYRKRLEEIYKIV